MNRSIKIAIGQINIFAGKPQENLAKMVKCIQQAKKERADIVIFPEMAISGYLLSDLWEDDAFVLECAHLSEKIKQASRGISVVFGNVLPDNRPSLFDPSRTSFGNDGRLRKFNAAYVYSHSQAADRVRPCIDLLGRPVFPCEGVTIKTLQPLYREFEDQRHFLSMSQYSLELGLDLLALLQPFKIGNLRMGVIICEDAWVRDYVYKGKQANPAQILAQNGADLIVTISASPFGWRKFDTRMKAVNRVQKSLFDINRPCPMINVNCVGFQNNGKNEFGFDGRSTVHNANGNLIFEAPAWKEGLYTTEVSLSKQSKTKKFHTFISQPNKKQERKELHDALVNGLKEFARQKNVQNFIVGLSGGIDSALVAYLCAQAIGPKHVLAVNMPSKFNSTRTKNTAQTVAGNLGIDYKVIPIEEIANLIRSTLNIDSEHAPIADENLQAKIRSVDILSNIAALYPNSVYTSNGNKTETLLGYFTLDGDGRGAICPLGDVFKTDIANLSVDINLTYAKTHHGRPLFPWELIAPIFVPETYFESRDKIASPIPKNIKTIVPSAELSDDQNVDKGRGDPIIFSYHDPLLRQFIEYRQNPERFARTLLANGVSGLSNLLDISPARLGQTIKVYFTKPSDWIADLENTWVLFHRAIYKQIQSPPIISVSKRSLGFDFRRSQSPAHFTQNYLALKKQILRKNNWKYWT